MQQNGGISITTWLLSKYLLDDLLVSLIEKWFRLESMLYISAMRMRRILIAEAVIYMVSKYMALKSEGGSRGN